MTVGAYFRLLEPSIHVSHILSERTVDVVVLVYLMHSDNQPKMSYALIMYLDILS